MLRINRLFTIFVLVTLIAGVWPPYSPALATIVNAVPDSPAQIPLADLLDTEGRLDLASGFRGSTDARGWQLVSGTNEAPAIAPRAAEQSGRWSDMFQPRGMNGDVYAVAVDGAGNVYVGGAFTSAGGVHANAIAKWDGSAWSALGSGVSGEMNSPGSVHALAVGDDGNLYAGGHFTTAGGVAANNVAKWDGSAWSPLGSGMSGVDYPVVYALAVDGAGNLYAGGSFTAAGGVVANQIAKWNGSTWSALGSGVNGQVDALAVDDADNLYAGGWFAAAGDVAANSIAKWDGAAWSALGSGMTMPVWASPFKSE